MTFGEPCRTVERTKSLLSGAGGGGAYIDTKAYIAPFAILARTSYETSWVGLPLVVFSER